MHISSDITNKLIRSKTNKKCAEMEKNERSQIADLSHKIFKYMNSDVNTNTTQERAENLIK